jgi:hypothetical protein
MATADNIRLLRRKRGRPIAKLTVLSKRVDEYEQAGQRKETFLLVYEAHLTDAWKEFTAIQSQLEAHGEDESAHAADIHKQFRDISTRIKLLLEKPQLASTPKPTSGESVTVSGPISIKTPYQHEPFRQCTSPGHSQTTTNALRASISVNQSSISRSREIDGRPPIKATSEVDRQFESPIRDNVPRNSE